MPPARLTAATTSRQWLNAKIGNSRPRSWASCVRMPAMVGSRNAKPATRSRFALRCAAMKIATGNPGRRDGRAQAAPPRRRDCARRRRRLRRGADARRRGHRRGRARHAVPALRVEGPAAARGDGAAGRDLARTARAAPAAAATTPAERVADVLAPRVPRARTRAARHEGDARRDVVDRRGRHPGQARDRLDVAGDHRRRRRRRPARRGPRRSTTSCACSARCGSRS